MRKVKFMLMATLVVAAVGGALAFKAKKFNDPLFCGTTNTTCPDFYDIYKPTVQASINDWYCSTNPTTDCNIRVTFDR